MSKVKTFYTAGVKHTVEKREDGSFIVSWTQSQRCFRSIATREYTRTFKTAEEMKAWFNLRQKRFDQSKLGLAIAKYKGQ